jgi:hypothetical protein
MRTADEILKEVGLQTPPGPPADQTPKVRKRRRWSRWFVVLVVMAVAAGGLLVYANRKPATEPALAFSPQPDRRFVWIGTTKGEQFTDEQFDQLATNFDQVVLAKFHAGFDYSKHQEAARQLVARNPSIKVYEYFSTKYWFDQNNWGPFKPDPAWLLRDNQGNIVNRYNTLGDGTREKVGEYLDVANPDYRAWAVHVITTWMKEAPFYGVAFDAADPIGDYNPPDISKWSNLLGSQRVAAYNAGIDSLLESVREAIGPNHGTIFNGISPFLIRGPNRDLDLLKISDGAMDERFCISSGTDTGDVRADIDVMQTYTHSVLLMKTNYGPTVKGDTRDRLSRYCLGSFLLGWVPGSSYFEFAPGYGAGQLDREPPNQKVAVGTPTTKPSFDGDVGTRSFTHGYVVVNTGTSPATVTLPRALDDVSDGRHVNTYAKGAKVTVPPGDARLFVDAGSVPR